MQTLGSRTDSGRSPRRGGRNLSDRADNVVAEITSNRYEECAMEQQPRSDHPGESTEEPVVIDCDDCAVRGQGCRDCVVSVLLGVPESLLADERAALDVLAEAGLAPRLRLVPVHRRGNPGLAS